MANCLRANWLTVYSVTEQKTRSSGTLKVLRRSAGNCISAVAILATFYYYFKHECTFKLHWLVTLRSGDKPASAAACNHKTNAL